MSTGESECSDDMFKPYRGVLPTQFKVLDRDVQFQFVMEHGTYETIRSNGCHHFDFVSGKYP